MGFLNSLGQVFSNRENFKKWESEQNNNIARRKVLAQNNPKSSKELEQAKKQGQVIIDIVDIMDAHSEDVAEKTETATAPFQALIPYAATMLSLFGSIKFISSPAINAADKVRKNFYESSEVEQLVKKITKYAQENDIDDLKYFSAYRFLNKKSMNELKNIDDNEIKTIYKKASELVEQLNKNPKIKNLNKKMGLSIAIPAIVSVATFVATTIFATKLQVNSSRIARWQSREMLNDPKYFVQYTPEQIEQAKQIVEAKEQQENDFSKKLFNKQEKSSLIQVIKDNKAYKAWKKQDSDESKMVQRELTPQELVEAERDKEVIQRITKFINNKAEDYSENMEVAADTFIMGTPFLGSAVGAIVSLVGNKTGALDKIANNNIEKLIKQLEDGDAQKIKTILGNLKKVTKDTPEYKNLIGKLRMSILESNFKVSTNSFFGNISNFMKKGINVALATNAGRNAAFSIVGGIVTSTVGLIIGLKLQKASARAGRYLAKRELEQDPNNFIGYSDEELKSVENVKAQKEPLGERFKEYITFIPRIVGEYFEYKKYQNTTAAKNRAIKEELVKMDVTDEQLKDAKNLQSKMFNTFEKVDDKSQEYSESVEAAAEIAKPAILGLGILGALSPAIIFGIQAARGKIKVNNVIEKTTKFLADKTGFLKGKTVKRYLDNVNKNLAGAATNIKAVTKNGDLESEFQELTIDTFKSILKNYKDAITQLDEKELLEGISKSDIPSFLKEAIKNSNKKQIDTILDNLEKIGNNIPQDDLEKIFTTFKQMLEKNPQEAMEMLKNSGTLKKIFLTKDIKIIGAVAGGTWASLNLILTFIFESYLAKLQKEAGRLGVMKAMEELDDARFYANTEQTQISQQNQVETNNNKYLL